MPLQSPLFILVKLVHLVDENLVSLVALELVNVNALRNLFYEPATLLGLVGYLLLLIFNAVHKLASLTLDFLRIHKFVHNLGLSGRVKFLHQYLTDRELPLLVSHMA